MSNIKLSKSFKYDLAMKFRPIVKLHKDERYFPINIEDYIKYSDIINVDKNGIFKEPLPIKLIKKDDSNSNYGIPYIFNQYTKSKKRYIRLYAT